MSFDFMLRECTQKWLSETHREIEILLDRRLVEAADRIDYLVKERDAEKVRADQAEDEVVKLSEENAKLLAQSEPKKNSTHCCADMRLDILRGFIIKQTDGLYQFYKNSPPWGWLKFCAYCGTKFEEMP